MNPLLPPEKKSVTEGHPHIRLSSLNIMDLSKKFYRYTTPEKKGCTTPLLTFLHIIFLKGSMEILGHEGKGYCDVSL